MAEKFSRQKLLEQIVSLGTELFERKLLSNPDEISGDDENNELRFDIKASEFYFIIHQYSHYSFKSTWIYYTFWFKRFEIDPGFDGGTLVISNAYEPISCYCDNGDYERGVIYDDEKLNACLSLIIKVFSELLEN